MEEWHSRASHISMGGSLRHATAHHSRAASQQGDSRSRRQVSEEKRDRRVTYANMQVAAVVRKPQTRASRIWRGTTTPPMIIAFDNEGA